MGDDTTDTDDTDDWAYAYRPPPQQPWETVEGWRSVYDLDDDVVVAQMTLRDAVQCTNPYDQVFAYREFNGGDVLVVHGDPDPHLVTLLGDGLARWEAAGLDERRRLLHLDSPDLSSWLFGDLTVFPDSAESWPVGVCLNLLEQADGNPGSLAAVTLKALLEMGEELPQFQDPALRTLLALNGATDLLARVRFRPGVGDPPATEVIEHDPGALRGPAWAQRGAADVADRCDDLDDQAVPGRFAAAVRTAWAGWEPVVSTLTRTHSVALFRHETDGRWAALAQPLVKSAWGGSRSPCPAATSATTPAAP